MSKGGKTALLIVIILLVLALLSVSGLTAYFVYKLVRDYDGDTNINTNSVTIESSWKLASSLEAFSEKEYDEFAEKIQTDLEEQNQKTLSDDAISWGLGDVEMAAEVPMAADGLGGGVDTSITNVQEAGVDEGDIVKSYGDYLVILRRGRIFTVQIKDGNKNLLEPKYKSNAYPKGYTSGTWYDEMLIYNNKVIVIGYSYSMEATEIGLFDISEDAQLTHADTYFIDSNDYYSSRNYASRLVDGKLLFYMPYYLMSWDYEGDNYVPRCKLPKIKKWTKNNSTTEGVNLLDKTDIYKPVQDTSTPTLHTVAACDLTGDEFTCEAQAILGPYARNFYVSPNSVYVWVSDYDYYSSAEETDAYVYAMPLDMQGVGVAKAYGVPIDQFSFKESDDYLNVLVQGEGFGEAMWNAEYSNSDLSLARIPLSEFDKSPDTLKRSYYTTLPNLEGYSMQNRFVGDYLLYGSGSSWWSEEENNDPLYSVNYKDLNISRLALDGGVDRIEVLDSDNAVVIGSDDEDLFFNWVSLPNTLVDTYTMEDAIQGETRSHGFFFWGKENILGLPVNQSGSQGYEQLWYESAAIKYLKVDRDNQEFKDLGSLTSSEDDRNQELTELDDDCIYSCVDWYGNSRPIFYDERIFALMGYELVEGEMSWSGDLKEKARTNYYNDL